MESGIYKIVCSATQKIYIGQSIDVYKRWEEHLRDLRNNKHCNKFLQEDFLKYGEVSFDFSVISLCEVEVLDLLETHYIKKYKEEGRSYNIIKNGTGKHKEKPSLTMDEYKKIINFRQEKTIINDENVIKILVLMGALMKSGFSQREYLDEAITRTSNIKKGVFDISNKKELLKSIKEIISFSFWAMILYINDYIKKKYPDIVDILIIKADFKSLTLNNRTLLLNCKIEKTGENFIKELYF